MRASVLSSAWCPASSLRHSGNNSCCSSSPLGIVILRYRTPSRSVMQSHCLSKINTVADSITCSSSLFVYHDSSSLIVYHDSSSLIVYHDPSSLIVYHDPSSLIVYHDPSSLIVICVAMSSLNGDSKLWLHSHAITERRFKVTVA